jgi:hypothetical protein
VILRVAARSLMAHPVRAAVLAGGFGLGVAVMATLLGVGEVILAQARSPALKGGGDVVVTGAAGRVAFARYLLANVLGAQPLRDRARAASPHGRALLYLVRDGHVTPVRGHGGVPSLERALGDPETAGVVAWQDTVDDVRWASPDAGELLRAMDRFHTVPAVPTRAGSWAEWLYFNGHTDRARFYLTFMFGPRRADGRRDGGVRLQLERDGMRTSFSAGGTIDDSELLADAPDLTLGGNSVRLEGTRYRLRLDLRGERGRSHVTGELSIEAAAGRSMPPIVIRGANGWQSGYVVPVMSGALSGALDVDGTRVALDGAGYHDHNWGFWDGVTWQWGQVQQGDLSVVYGRLHPPPDAADPDRVPGFLAVLGPNGPLGYATGITITESSAPGAAQPQHIRVEARGPALHVDMDLQVADAVTTAMPRGSFGGGMDFIQMRARYRVQGDAAGRQLDFEAPGAAETFRGATSP